MINNVSVKLTWLHSRKQHSINNFMTVDGIVWDYSDVIYKFGL